MAGPSGLEHSSAVEARNERAIMRLRDIRVYGCVRFVGVDVGRIACQFVAVLTGERHAGASVAAAVSGMS